MELKEIVTKEQYLALKGLVKEKAAECADLRKRASQTSGRERYELHEERRGHSFEARVYNLAYAFVKGRSWRNVEPKFNADLAPTPGAIVGVLQDKVSIDESILKEKVRSFHQEGRDAVG